MKPKSIRKDIKLHSLREKGLELTAKNKLLIKENARLEKELFATLEIKKNTKSFDIFTPKSSSLSEVTPIILASDFHVEEEVKGITVNNLNIYNLKVAEQRSIRLFQNAIKLIEKERQDSKIQSVVLALLGDFISGSIHEPLLPICQLRPMEAIIFAQELLISGIEAIVRETKLNVIIPCTVGNHSRVTDKVWIATENGYSLEYLMYKNMERYFRGNTKVKFVISEGQHCYLDIYKYRLRFLHGTQFRYMQGVGGFTIPVIKKIQRWDAAIPAYYTFAGHLHQFFDGNPRFLINGSLIGYNTYAMAIGAEFQKPCQSMIVLSQKYGKAGVNPIFVD